MKKGFYQSKYDKTIKMNHVEMKVKFKNEGENTAAIQKTGISRSDEKVKTSGKHIQY